MKEHIEYIFISIRCWWECYVLDIHTMNTLVEIDGQNKLQCSCKKFVYSQEEIDEIINRYS